MQVFNDDIIRYFPQWNFHEYEACDIAEALEHIYYASHISGPKEVLYKAGLSNLAYHLHEFESYNAIGTTPGEIIGQDIPRLSFGLIKNHAFRDGNKRIGALVLLTLLELNGYPVKATNAEFADIIMGVAASEKDEKDLLEWVEFHS